MVLVALLVCAWAGAVALARPISDFYAAGHVIPAAYNGMAIAACFVAALAYPALAGALGPGWRDALLVLAGGAGGLLVIALLLAPYLRRSGGYTLPDFLGERFGSAGLRPLAVAAVFLCSFPALAAVVLALDVIVARLFALDLPSSLGAAVAMLFLCTFPGGMRSASRAAVAQYVVLLAGSVAALGILLWQRGATSGTLAASPLLDALAALNLDMFVAPDRVNRMALIFCLVAGTAALPHLVMRTFTARSIEEARSSFLYAIPLLLVIFLASPAYVPLFSGDAVAAGDRLSAVSMGLIAAAAIAALLALGSGLLLAMANAVSYDLYYKSWDVTAPADRRLLVARGAILLIAGLAAVGAFFLPRTTLVVAGASFSVAASAFLPALLLGVWWKRANGQGALAGMIAGLIVCLYYMIVPRYFPYAFYETSRLFSSASKQQASAYDLLQRMYYLADPANRPAVAMLWESNVRAIANWWGVRGIFAGVFGVPVGLVVTIAVSLLTPAPSEDVQSFVEDLRKPQPAAA
jgi:cation/acetate symporter